jgi:hypothetical protein
VRIKLGKANRCAGAVGIGKAISLAQQNQPMKTRDCRPFENPLAEHFRRHGLDFELADGGLRLRARLSGRNAEGGAFPVSVRFDSATQLLLVQVGLQLAVPLPRRTDAAALANRLNAGLNVGNYEAMPDSGAVGFRLATWLPNSEPLPEEMARTVMGSALYSADDAYPAFATVITHGLLPALAIAVASNPENN